MHFTANNKIEKYRKAKKIKQNELNKMSKRKYKEQRRVQTDRITKCIDTDL